MRTPDTETMTAPLPPLPYPMWVHYEHSEPEDSPNAVRVFSSSDMETYAKLAIREVLAERDRYLDIIRREAWLEHASENDVESPYVPFTDWVAEKKRAERAEAECERLRKDAERLDYIEKHARCDPKMDGHHVWWPTTFKNALRGCNLREAIDAAIEQGRK